MPEFKVRDKILIILAAVILILSGAFFFLSRAVLLDSLVSLEETYVYEHVLRAGIAVQNKVDYLARLTADWASWNDTYDFIVDLNQDYIRTNVVDSALRELQINFMIFIDSGDRVVHSRCYDPHSETGGACSDELTGAVAGYWAELLDGDPDGTGGGLMVLPNGTFFAACRPILRSEDSGPARGRFVMGRRLDTHFIEQIGETVNFALSLRAPDSRQVLSALPAADHGNDPELPAHIVHQVDRNSIAGYYTLKDLRGKPVAALEILIPRHLYARGAGALFHFALWSLATGFMVITLLYFLLDRFVVSRLARVHECVRHVTATDDLRGLIELEGTDEIAGLARELNAMGTRLSAAHATLQSQEERLRRVSFELLHAQETERKRISHELHDEFGQNLSLLKMRVKHLGKSIKGLTGTQERELREEIPLTIDSLINSVRRLTKDLSPSVLDDLGLWASIEWLGRRYQPFFPVSVDIAESAGRMKFPPEEGIEVFRIVQEALSNAAKHSGAKTVDVRAFVTDGSLVVRIEDDGKGFDRLEGGVPRCSEEGMGLSIMAQRAGMLGGGLDIRTEPGRGTGITLTVPVIDKEAAGDE